MPPNTEPEIEGPVTWCVEYHLPNALFVKYFGEDAALGGEGFRANFYKCVRLPPPTSLPARICAWALAWALLLLLPARLACLRFRSVRYPRPLPALRSQQPPRRFAASV